MKYRSSRTSSFSERGKEVERIFRDAVRQALWRRKRLGQSVAASRDGKVVIVLPEEIPVDDDGRIDVNDEI
jgi:hypothetical protein